MNQLEGFIRVFFSSHNLLNGTQSKFLEAEGISGHIPIEGSTVHQTHNQTIGHSVLKQVGNVKAGQVALHAEGEDFTADGGVGSQFFPILSGQTNFCTRFHSNEVDKNENAASHLLPPIFRPEPPHSKTG